MDEKTDKKAKAAAVKLQKEKNKIERAIEVAEKKKLVAEEKLRKVVEKQALQELKAVATPAKAISQMVSTLPKTPRKCNISTLSPIV